MGMWRCEECETLNDEGNNVCYICFAPKPYNAGSDNAAAESDKKTLVINWGDTGAEGESADPVISKRKKAVSDEEEWWKAEKSKASVSAKAKGKEKEGGKPKTRRRGVLPRVILAILNVIMLILNIINIAEVL